MRWHIVSCKCNVKNTTEKIFKFMWEKISRFLFAPPVPHNKTCLYFPLTRTFLEFRCFSICVHPNKKKKKVLPLRVAIVARKERNKTKNIKNLSVQFFFVVVVFVVSVQRESSLCSEFIVLSFGFQVIFFFVLFSWSRRRRRRRRRWTIRHCSLVRFVGQSDSFFRRTYSGWRS